jgi:lipopolysaccharide heptosyltransferase II
MKKILIIQTAFIGDVILSTPLITNLHDQFPNIQIDYLVKKGNEELLSGHPNVNKVFLFDKGNKWVSLRENIRLIRQEKYDTIINLHRYASSGLICALSGAKQKIGFKKNPFFFLYSKSYKHAIGNGEHEVDRNLSLIASFCDITIRKPSLYPSNEDYAFVSKFQDTAYYCLAPASIWFTKQAPISTWLKLIDQLSDADHAIFLMGGPNDRALCEQIISESSRVVRSLAGELSIMQSVAFMKNAKRNFVNDSGPLHFASAVNAPVTAFFCSTIPAFGFGPLSDDANIIEVAGLPCRPCGLHGHKTCPEGHFKCGELPLEDY